MAVLIRRTACNSALYISLRCLSTTSTRLCSSSPEPALPPLTPAPHAPRLRTRTPTEKQFETWIELLKPGFTHSDVEEALRSVHDPDLALDIFRWTAQQRHYKHDHLTYLTMIRILVSGKRYRAVEALIDEVMAGVCPGSLPLFNTMIKFCCGRRLYFNRAFDIYKKLLKSEDAKPNLETYALLLSLLLRKFDKLSVCYVYLPSVRSLAKQMKASGIIPDTFVLNMIIKAFSKCLEMDEAVRVFREMGLYGCEPNAYTYSYLTKGCCEKGRLNQALSFYRDMRGKGLVPKGRACLSLICSLALERKFQDAIDITVDLLGNSMSLDFLTYRTLLDEMCRDGRGNEAFDLLERFRKQDTLMNERTYNTLLNELRFCNRDY